MPSERMRILVDTNVWLDLFDGSRVHGRASAEALRQLQSRDVDLLFATSSVKDVYYLLLNKLKYTVRKETGTLDSSQLSAAESYVNACIKVMNTEATAVAVDMSDIWLAEKYSKQFSDFEDCLIIAAARRAHADCIITNDERFLRQRLFATMRPIDALQLARG